MTVGAGQRRDPRANPMAGNPFVTKDDVRRAVVDLVDPIVPYLSPGNARARLGSSGAVFAPRVAELEGYARPLWGIVPLVAGGGGFAHWERWVAGLANGVDPDGPEYWGPCGAEIDQRMVEMAAIGFALAFVPEYLFDPLTGRQRDHVIEWLRGIERGEPAQNNWQFFRLLVQMGLERVGVEIDRDAQARSVELVDSYAIGGGWYTDGSSGNIDYYVPFALHTYGLILAASGLGDRGAAERYVERARQFAPDFQHWFAPDGAAVPFGRSLTYRFAQGSFWGALAMADVDALDWATVRGLALRHLRWWSDRPISDRDGVLSVGYGYDNRKMSESYNSAGSPYWCMKVFAMLAASDDHPFWTVAEADALPPSTVTFDRAGMVIGRDRGQVVALFARSGGWSFGEQSEAKYQKFAYSSRFGFSGDFDQYGMHTTDSMLAVTDTASGVRRVRDRAVLAETAAGVALARWMPFPDVQIDTALCGGAPWHVRIHRVSTGRELALTETGFALPWEPEGFGPARPATADDGHATASSPWGASTIADVRQHEARPARAADLRALSPNANVMYPHVVVPALDAAVAPGVHWFACAVGASDDASAVDVAVVPRIPADVVDELDKFANRQLLDGSVATSRDNRLAHAPSLRPERTILGISAVLLPFDPDGAVDWSSFESLLDHTVEAGLVPAVNMDTGYVQLIDEETRVRVLEAAAAHAGSAGFVAGAFVSDLPGARFEVDAYLDAMERIASRGGTPVVFPSNGLNALGDMEWVAAHEALGRRFERFIGFELGPMFVPYGRIYSLDAYEGLLDVSSCIGAKHSSLSRAAEWDRLALRDHIRPDFHVFTGNDLAIDMVCYGSDYLLGLSAFAPEAFAERDRRWAAGDRAFHGLNDLLQYLGFFAFRPPVPAYRHDAAMFLALRGRIASNAAPPGVPTRPDTDCAVLADIAERLEALL